MLGTIENIACADGFLKLQRESTQNWQCRGTFFPILRILVLFSMQGCIFEPHYHDAYLADRQKYNIVTCETDKLGTDLSLLTWIMDVTADSARASSRCMSVILVVDMFARLSLRSSARETSRRTRCHSCRAENGRFRPPGRIFNFGVLSLDICVFPIF